MYMYMYSVVDQRPPGLRLHLIAVLHNIAVFFHFLNESNV